MKLSLVFYDYVCSTKIFTINGIIADYYDFGDKRDTGKDETLGYGCGNMVFLPDPPTEGVLSKYSITKEEYMEICEKLEEGLSFGRCGLCI